MSTFYEARIADPFGNHLDTIANFVEGDNSAGGAGAALDYVLNVGQIGVATLTIPATHRPDLYIPDRLLDGRIGLWRSINGRAPALDGDAIFLARIFKYTNDATILTAFHVNELFARRIIAYSAYTGYSSKGLTGADNTIKQFIREQMGTGIVGGFRDGDDTQADISAYVSVQANLSLGPNIAKAAARRNLLETIIELCQASTTAGTYLATEIVSSSDTGLEARTYATARGVDHTATSAQPVILSVANGRLRNAVLTLDYSQEITVAIAGGAGEADKRLIATAIDTTRMGMTPFNRREKFVDMSNITDTTQLQDEADAALRAGRPQRILTADLVETPSATRGIHFDLGDIVTVEHRGLQFDARLDIVHETMGANGRQSQIQLRGVL